MSNDEQSATKTALDFIAKKNTQQALISQTAG